MNRSFKSLLNVNCCFEGGGFLEEGRDGKLGLRGAVALPQTQVVGRG